VIAKAALGLAQLAIWLGLALFAPAGTLPFVEAWGSLALFLTASLAITTHLRRLTPPCWRIGRRRDRQPRRSEPRRSSRDSRVSPSLQRS
jgi:membrane protein implicated in regulation of membrane protease activity